MASSFCCAFLIRVATVEDIARDALRHPDRVPDFGPDDESCGGLRVRMTRKSAGHREALPSVSARALGVADVLNSNVLDAGASARDILRWLQVPGGLADAKAGANMVETFPGLAAGSAATIARAMPGEMPERHCRRRRTGVRMPAPTPPNCRTGPESRESAGASRRVHASGRRRKTIARRRRQRPRIAFLVIPMGFPIQIRDSAFGVARLAKK